MLESCKCGKNKIETEREGRFIYQICSECNEVVRVIYLAEKQKSEHLLEF
jgi:hypothetical protein